MRSLSFRMTLGIILISCHALYTQNWTTVDPQTIAQTGIRDIQPRNYITYQLDYQAMKELLWSAPYEYVQNPHNSNTIIRVGMADGCADMFRVVQYDMFEAPLAAQFPDIKTFRGISISDPYRTIRIDWTNNGFRAVISDLKGKMYIDPFQRNDMINRIAYYKKDYSRDIDWSCGVSVDDGFMEGEFHLPRLVGDCVFRSYRLAMATTGEYSNFFGATSAAQSGLVMSQVVTAVNRVNEVYEIDMSVRLILIANTDDVFYYDPGGDPYNNENGSVMLGQNQATLDAVIGTANYDIGHAFSTGGGGVAYLASVCNSALKAGGVTGSSNPVGDPFIIDYVAHEMGHQLGANHTQNNNCNRNAATAMEPGSASTIMGYAGICPPDVQNNSDAYMHGISQQEIAAVVTTTNCDATVSSANTPPVVLNVPNYTIPISTPFVLTASATDDENNPLTYCWEQWDPEVGTMPPVSTNVVGPMFRSLTPTASSSRYFPNLPDLVNNINPTWEELPSVTREMEFRITVRDFNGLYGCTDEDNTLITTTATSGPFVVTSQNTPTTWSEGTTETITWNVANTTAAPVSCANVDIRLSVDGGMTYPTVLSMNEPNDGSATVSIPAGTTTMGRVMVKGANTIFFDINNANITINPGLPNFTLTLNPSSVTECNDGMVQTTVEVGQFMGFTDPVTLSILNLPPGASATFNPQVVIPGSNSLLTVSNLAGLFGTYTPTVRGTSSTGDKDAIFTINLLSAPANGPTLISPANNATDAVITPVLDWQTVSGSTQYEYQVAYDNGFSLIATSGITIPDQYQITAPLLVGQQYFWRTRSHNSCGIGPWSSAFSFTTVSCFALLSSDVPVTIPASGAPIVTSEFVSNIDMVISDVNVIQLTGTHTYVDDLKFTLIAPDNTERLIWNRPCTNHDNFNINFDDEAAPGSWPCPPIDGLTYKPSNTLSFFDGKNSGGTWILEIEDIADQDGGALNSWGLKVCGDLTCQLVVTQTSGAGAGSLAAALACAGPGDTVRLSAILSGLTIDVGAVPLVIGQDVVIMAEGANTTIAGSGTRIFEITSSADVEFLGMTIVAGTSLTGGAINNPGIVRLKNVTIERNPATPTATVVQNTPGGQLFVTGSCYLYQ